MGRAARTGLLALVVAASLWLAASASAGNPEPWLAAGDVQRALSDAETAIVLGVVAVVVAVVVALVANRRLTRAEAEAAAATALTPEPAA